jgi:hypothetical protein
MDSFAQVIDANDCTCATRLKEQRRETGRHMGMGDSGPVGSAGGPGVGKTSGRGSGSGSGSGFGPGCGGTGGMTGSGRGGSRISGDTLAGMQKTEMKTLFSDDLLCDSP